MEEKCNRVTEILKRLLKAKSPDEINDILDIVEFDDCKEVIKMLVTTLTELGFVKFLEEGASSKSASSAVNCSRSWTIRR